MHGTREYDFLQVAPFLHQVFDRVAVGNAHYILLDDRPLVEVRRDIMASGADQPNATLKSLVVWLGAYERGQAGNDEY